MVFRRKTVQDLIVDLEEPKETINQILQEPRGKGALPCLGFCRKEGVCELLVEEDVGWVESLGF